ncbi:MAG: SGNH family hydrolase [Methylocystis sp.]
MTRQLAFSLLARKWRLAAFLALLSATQVSDALAQDFFSDLFGGGGWGGGGWGGGERAGRKHHRRRDSDYDYGYEERRYDAWRERRVRRMAPQKRNAPVGGPAPVEAAKAEVKEKDPAAFRVTVLGDAFSQLLAAGLDQSFATDPKIAVLRRGNDNSGLVRSDYYDWMKAAREIADDPKKPDMAVIMIGGNDRQALTAETGAQEALSPRWRELYGSRVEGLIQIFKDKGIPVVWVGLPVMQPAGYSAAIAQINEIFRSSAAKADVPFVDLWDKFTDEHGQYSAIGPDEKGQIVRLRSADGIHFTEAGARKVALFVEGEIKRLYEEREANTPESRKPGSEAPAPAAPPPAAPVTFRPPAETPSPDKPPTLPADRADVGQVQPLTNVAAPRSDDLAHKDSKQQAAQDAAIERAVAAHVFVKGGVQPARAGRADDSAFRAPAPAAPVNQ